MPYDTDNRSGITKNASESRVIATESQKEEKSKFDFSSFCFTYETSAFKPIWNIHILLLHSQRLTATATKRIIL